MSDLTITKFAKQAGEAHLILCNDDPSLYSKKQREQASRNAWFAFIDALRELADENAKLSKESFKPIYVCAACTTEKGIDCSQKIQEITNLAAKRFPSFGGGKKSNFNPVAIAFSDSQPMFAAGVDIEAVVRFVLAQVNHGNIKTGARSVTKDELIVKQQLEIEDLKTEIETLKGVCREVRGHLWRPEQWSTKCPEFPKVAMLGIVKAMRAVDDI